MKIWVLQIKCTAQEAVVKCLKTRLAVDEEKIKEYNKAMHTLNGEVNILTTQVEKSGGTARWAKKLAEVNSILTEFKDS